MLFHVIKDDDDDGFYFLCVLSVEWELSGNAHSEEVSHHKRQCEKCVAGSHFHCFRFVGVICLDRKLQCKKWKLEDKCIRNYLNILKYRTPKYEMNVLTKRTIKEHIFEIRKRSRFTLDLVLHDGIPFFHVKMLHCIGRHWDEHEFPYCAEKGAPKIESVLLFTKIHLNRINRSINTDSKCTAADVSTQITYNFSLVDGDGICSYHNTSNPTIDCSL